MRRLSIALLVATACGTDATPAPVAAAPSPLDTLIKAQMRAGGIPGLGATIIQPGQPTWTEAFGLANVKDRVDIEPHTLFITASISKTVFAMTLMQLVEDGVIDLDAAADQYVPFAIRDPAHPDVPVTVRMLMSHTSGLADDWIELGSATSIGDSKLSLAEFAEGYVTAGGRFYADRNWAREPGTRHSYSNAAFGVLGAVVEGASGQSLPHLAKTRLFAPLQMNDTGWHLADVDEALLSIPYGGTWTDGFVAGKHQGFAFYPATGLRSSIVDMTRFLQAFMNLGELDGARVLEAATVSSMHALQYPELSTQRALVWRYRTINGRRYLGHSGSTVGGAGIVVFSPDTGVGLIVLSNSDAFIRDRFGFPEGADALQAILEAMERTAVGEPLEDAGAAI